MARIVLRYCIIAFLIPKTISTDNQVIYKTYTRVANLQGCWDMQVELHTNLTRDHLSAIVLRQKSFTERIIPNLGQDSLQSILLSHLFLLFYIDLQLFVFEIECKIYLLWPNINRYILSIWYPTGRLHRLLGYNKCLK